ncbi:hypothetical protein [Methylobacterium sp. PvR107]|uniref:hypothetical protein n=1 Tax=Methylobacterium sp. PvR107 TaxID=2806597 RepID=UPI001AE2E189|nr:hypothetical protein [Methylobacterium sp. PvR107]MBP1180010.1 hypothetical protein [Methylobacterium sp. PvR107]
MRNAELSTRVSRIIRDLSCTTATIPPGADLKHLRERLGTVRGRLEATADTIRNSAEHIPPATQAAPPSLKGPSTQDAATPVRAGKAQDEAAVEGVGRVSTTGQSRECVTSAGAGGASAASADTAPAADGPRMPRSEPEVRDTSGGLVQDGGPLKPPAQVLSDTRSVKDRVLDLFAAEGLTTKDLAKRTGAPEGSVGGWISLGRKAGDQRVKDGDAKRDARIAAVSAQPTPRDVADSAKPVTPAPAIPVGQVEIPAGKLIAIRGAEVHGPLNVWRTSKEIAKAFGIVADGQLYGLEAMARHGGLDPKVCINLIPMWTAALAKIGIELHHHKGYGVRIRAIGGQA